jgi:hypothetical protein
VHSNSVSINEIVFYYVSYIFKMDHSTQLLIGKVPVFPLIDKLQVIHIYEVDWSLINKFYIAQRLNKIATKEATVPIEQAGGRPGRSVTELALSRVIT